MELDGFLADFIADKDFFDLGWAFYLKVMRPTSVLTPPPVPGVNIFLIFSREILQACDWDDDVRRSSLYWFLKFLLISNHCTFNLNDCI